MQIYVDLKRKQHTCISLSTLHPLTGLIPSFLVVAVWGMVFVHLRYLVLLTIIEMNYVSDNKILCNTLLEIP